MDQAAFNASFSLPIGPGVAYPPPPYTYRGVEDIFIAYEADPAGVEALLPPGLTAADETPVCIAWARWIPFSAFGPYHEAYVMIRANLNGETYLYQPFIFTDNEIPLVAGREIWGYAKKLAVMERSSGGAGQPFGEQMLFTVERPRGHRIMTMSFAADRLFDPADARGPAGPVDAADPERRARPAVGRTARRASTSRRLMNRSADGTPKLWTGRASVTMDARLQVDPWHLLAPTRIIQGFVRGLRLRPRLRQGRARLPGRRRRDRRHERPGGSATS